MKFKRKIEVDLERFELEVGDTFTFKMKDGEKVKVRAVRKYANGDTLFIFEDCLKDEYTINEILNEGALKEIYKRIPKKIRRMLVTFSNDKYLRLPTEKEIFGVNECGEDEGWSIVQFECMKKKKNRVASQGYGTNEYRWYFLNSKKRNTDNVFICVGTDGEPYYTTNNNYNYIRPIFCIRQSENHRRTIHTCSRKKTEREWEEPSWLDTF